MPRTLAAVARTATDRLRPHLNLADRLRPGRQAALAPRRRPGSVVPEAGTTFMETARPPGTTQAGRVSGSIPPRAIRMPHPLPGMVPKAGGRTPVAIKPTTRQPSGGWMPGATPSSPPNATATRTDPTRPDQTRGVADPAEQPTDPGAAPMAPVGTRLIPIAVPIRLQALISRRLHGAARSRKASPMPYGPGHARMPGLPGLIGPVNPAAGSASRSKAGSIRGTGGHNPGHPARPSAGTHPSMGLKPAGSRSRTMGRLPGAVVPPAVPSVRTHARTSTRAARTVPASARLGESPASAAARRLVTPANPAPAAPRAAAPPTTAPAPGPWPATTSRPLPPTEQPAATGGDILFDGARMGRWLARALAADAARPPATGAGFDPRRTPAWAPSFYVKGS